jgi:hypothetical protein
MSRSILLLALAAALASGSVANAAVTVTIDKSIQQMRVEVDGRALYQWSVSTGRPGYDTPNGKFKAFRMEKDHFSKEWDDAPMPYSIFFTQKGHAIHGYLDTKNIGRPASHGCVRLTKENAEKLYALVEQEGVLNTTVILTGTTPTHAPAVARRTLPRPGDTDQYAQPRYGQPQYGQPQYGRPQDIQPQYGQRWQQPANGDPYYAQRQYQQQQPAPYYAQPPYGQPQYGQPYGQQQQGYVYRDPYADPYQRPRTLFPF